MHVLSYSKDTTDIKGRCGATPRMVRLCTSTLARFAQVRLCVMLFLCFSFWCVCEPSQQRVLKHTHTLSHAHTHTHEHSNYQTTTQVGGSVQPDPDYVAQHSAPPTPTPPPQPSPARSSILPAWMTGVCVLCLLVCVCAWQGCT